MNKCSPVDFLNEKCPNCGARLISNGKYKWCSYVLCSFGILRKVKVEDKDDR